MRDSILTVLTVVGLAGVLAGCGAGSYLTTGSVGAAQAPVEKPVTPSERALYNAANIARAQRCGFHFQPEQLRANYLAAETQAGTPPDMLARITKEFDYTRQTIAASTAKDDTYCTEFRTRVIKTTLTRQLAGDFNPPAKRQTAGGGGLFDNSASPRSREVFNPEGVFDPQEKTTRKVED